MNPPCTAVLATSLPARRVVARMKQHPNEYFWNHGTVIPTDGRVLNDMRLMPVKRPGTSKRRDDVMRQVALVPGTEAAKPLPEGSCRLAQGAK